MKTENNGSREIPYLSVLNEKMGAYLGWFYAYTFAVWALMVAQFLTNGEVVLHAGMIGVYITFLTAYTGQKELTRWSLDKNYRRIWGELWVYIWLATGLVLWPLASIFPKTFQCAPSAELATIIGIVITFFTGSEFSKFAYKVQRVDKKTPSG